MRILDDMIAEVRGCIYDWTTLSQFYRSAPCQLERALTLIKDKVPRDEIKSYIGKFEAAHAAVKVFALAFIRGQLSEQKWLELGFSG